MSSSTRAPLQDAAKCPACGSPFYTFTNSAASCSSCRGQRRLP